MMPHPSDTDLVTYAKQGDQKAFTQLYERYAAAIYRYIYFRVGEAELAEDLQADVFVRMLEGLDRYEERGWPLSAWLYRIAHDRTVDTLRRRKYRRHVPYERWDGWYDGPEHTVAARLEREEVLHVLNDLTNEQREVILLRFISGMSIQEVADKLDRSEGSVKALQHRGLQSLARLMNSRAVPIEELAA